MLSFSFPDLLRSAGCAAQALHRSARKVTTARPLALLAVPALLGSLALVGCGGSGSAPASSTAAAQSYAGQYASTIDLGGGQTGKFDMTVANDGNAAATLNIDNGAAARAAAPTRAVVATYMLTGKVNLQKGSFLLDGRVVSASGITPIQASGTLPGGSGSSTLLSLLFNGGNYRGTLARTGSGSTTIGGTVGTGPNSTVNFAGATGTNANTASYSGITAVAVQNLPFIGNTTSIVVALPNGSRQVTININAALTAGAIFVPGDDNTTVQYVDGTKMWNGAGRSGRHRLRQRHERHLPCPQCPDVSLPHHRHRPERVRLDRHVRSLHQRGGDGLGRHHRRHDASHNRQPYDQRPDSEHDHREERSLPRDLLRR